MAVFLLCVIFICTLLQKLLFKYLFRNATTDDEGYDAKKKRLKAERAAQKAQKTMQKGAC